MGAARAGTQAPCPLLGLLPPPPEELEVQAREAAVEAACSQGPAEGHTCLPSLGFLTRQVEAIRVSTSQASVRTMNEDTERLARGAAQSKCLSVGSHHPLSIALLISCRPATGRLRPGA